MSQLHRSTPPAPAPQRRARNLIVGSWLLAVTALSTVGACSAAFGQSPPTLHQRESADTTSRRIVTTRQRDRASRLARTREAIGSMLVRTGISEMADLVLDRLPIVTRARGALQPLLQTSTATRNRASATGDPIAVSVANLNAGPNQDRSLCLQLAAARDAAYECGDIRMAHALPSVRINGQVIAPVLSYSSQTAHPFPLVAVNITAGNTVPTSVSARLWRTSGGSGDSLWASASWSGSDWSSNAKRRVVMGFDGRTQYSGVFSYRVDVTAYYSGGDSATGSATGVLSIINRSGSPFGAGWWLDGLEYLGYYYVGGHRELLTHGDGSTSYYVYDGTRYRGTNPTWSDSVQYNGSFYWRPLRQGGEVRYTAGGAHLATVDRLGHETRYVWSGGYLDSLVFPIAGGSSVGYKFNYTSGRLSSVGAPGGRTLNVSILAASGWPANLLSSFTDPDGSVTTFNWHSGTNRPSLIIDKRSHWQRFFFDGAGKLTDAMIDTVGYSYVPLTRTGFCAAESQGSAWSACATAAQDSANIYTRVDGPRSDVSDSAFVWIDQWGNSVKVQDALGNVSTTLRDTLSRPLLARSALGAYTRYTWTNSDLTQVKDSTTGRRLVFGYDTVYHEVVGAWVNDTVVHSANWDNGLLNWSWDKPASVATQFFYDNFGRDTLTIDPGGHKTRNVYGGTLGNLTDVYGPYVTLSSSTPHTSFVYDAYGRTLKTVRADGGRDSVVYDGADRVTKQYAANDDTTRFTYDGDYLRSVIDPKNHATAFGRNAAGWVRRDSEPDGAIMTASFDAAGNVTSAVSRRAITVSSTYDALGRLLTRKAGADSLTYSYAADGTWHAAHSFKGDTIISIDSTLVDKLGRDTLTIINHKLAGDSLFEVASHYDPFTGKRDSVTYRTPGSATRYTRWVWGIAGNLKAIRSNVTELTKTFTAEGLDSATNFPTVTAVNAQRASNHEETSQTWGSASALNTTTALDSLGRIRTWIGGTSTNAVRYFGYDLLGRLISADDSVRTGVRTCHFDPEYGRVCTSGADSLVTARSYSYDGAGNHTENSTVVDAANRVQSIGSGSAQWFFEYDADGNLTRKSYGSTGTRTWERTFAWDSLGRLVRVATNSVDTLWFRYDGLGRRVWKRRKVGTSADTATRYIWDGDVIALELTGGGDVQVQYAHYPALDTPFAVLRSFSGAADTSYIYAQDQIGNVTGLFRASDGGVTDKYAYDPWGYPDYAQTVDNTKNRLRWKGAYYDTEDALYYMRARYYDLDLKGFISEDPIGVAGGNNLYAFVGGDAVNASDPTGNDKCTQLQEDHGAVTITLPDGTKECKLGQSASPVTVIGKMDGFLAREKAYILILLHDIRHMTAQDWARARRDGATLTGALGSGSFGGPPIPTAGPPSPLTRTVYTSKARDQMSKDAYHGFLLSVDGFAGYGQMSALRGGDGVLRTRVTLSGSIFVKKQWRDGVFEWIIEPNNDVNHRFFIRSP